jgi:hypothetical protein
MKIENCKMKISNLANGYNRGPLFTRGRPDCLTNRREANFQFSIFNFEFSILFRGLALCASFIGLCLPASAQVIADKTVASVTNGSRSTPDLITYSDLVWQLALEPKTPFSDKPSSENLNRALRVLEDQVLVLQEARKLPTAEPPDVINAEVSKRRDELAKLMGSEANLRERMARVGLSSEQLDSMLRDRVMVDKYFDFRFRAFVVIGQKEITDRYNETYGRLRNSGRIVPTLEEKRSEIEEALRVEKIAAEIDAFVDNLHEQPGTEIVVISPV